MFAPWCSGACITTIPDHVLCCASSLSPIWLLATPWIVAGQTPLSMGFSRQEYRSGLLCPPPGDLPNPGIERRSVAFSTKLTLKIVVCIKITWRAGYNVDAMASTLFDFSSNSLGALELTLGWWSDSYTEWQIRRCWDWECLHRAFSVL